MDNIAKEIIIGKVKHWPSKGLLSCGKFSVKYEVLNKIGAANWAPTNHSSNITLALSKLIFQFGTKSKLNFREYVFDQTMKHADSFVVKLPIDFPCLISGLILKKYHEVLHPKENSRKKVRPLTLDKKLFVRIHVLDIVVKHQGQTTGGNSSPVSKTSINDVLLKLIEVSKAL